jgi:hypothetical protein
MFKDETFPILNAVQGKGNKSLPELSLIPVGSAYSTLEDYCSTFTSLILHEVWATLCENVGTGESQSLTSLIHPDPTFCNGFTLLRCEALSPTRITNMDLFSITFNSSRQKPPKKIFDVAEHVRYRSWEIGEIDPRLLKTCQDPNIPITSFVLRILMYHVPPNLGSIFTVTRISRLNTVFKQIIQIAELARSPLCEVILHPSDYEDAFKLDAVLDDNHAFLNPIQYKAVASITKEVSSAEREPKVALLQGPPG